MEKMRYYLKSFIGILFFIVILFISAGRIDYVEGWIYTILSIFGWLLNVVSIREDTELLEERSAPPKDAKEWDKRILKLSAFMTLIATIVAGLESGRFQQSPDVQWDLCLTGMVLMIGGQLLFLAAKKANTFFSSVVRIQLDRGQTVCESGPYRFVRHPGYVGMILSWIGFPLVLGSVWSTIPTAAAVILLLVRTDKEDKVLMDELSGYSQYVQKVRYKLFPGLW
jgi:protein-S-isoprenylcysteine O-methyltransferase Ste14